MHRTPSLRYLRITVIYVLLFLQFNCGGGGSDAGAGGQAGGEQGGQQQSSLAVPQDLVARALGSDSIQLEWEYAGSTATNILVERSIDANNFSQIAIVASDAETYIAAGLIASTEYYFRLRASNAVDFSDYTAIRPATTEESSSLHSCIQPQEENILFVDVGNICGDCSDSIAREDNAINNAWCSIAQAASVAQPGDTIYIRAGEYKESVTLSQSGEQQAPITFSAYAGEEVIMEGGEYLNGWSQCESQVECGGNSNWQNIYYSFIPAEHAAEVSALVANLFQGEEMLAVSQEPDMPDPFYIDDIDNYHSINIGEQTLTTLTDPVVFSALSSTFWQDAYALLWVTHNRVEFRKIDSYDTVNHVITYAETDAPPYDDREGKYSIYNGVQQIDNPGEYSIAHDLEQDGTRKTYLWPLGGVMNRNSIRYSARNFGININRQSYITIQGLKVQRYTGSELIHGVGIGSVTQGAEIDGVVIRNNQIRFNRHATRGYGGIFIYGCNDCSVDSNRVAENVRHAGIFLSNPTRSTIKNNVVYKPGQTGIRYYYADQSSIINNEISGCSGSHANTITVYLWSNDILIANNYIHDSLGYMTLQRSNNITIYNNIVDAAKSRIAVAEFGNESSGTWVVANNTFINSEPSTSLMFGNYGADFIVKNNILDGFCPPNGATVDRNNNIYTGLMWCQGNQYGWELVDSEVIEEDLGQIFSSPATENYTPLGNSYASASGADISDVLPSDIFTDFRFDLDFDGKIRGMTNPAVGALEP